MRLAECVYTYGRAGATQAEKAWVRLLSIRPDGGILNWIEDAVTLRHMVQVLPNEAIRALQITHRMGRCSIVTLLMELSFYGVERMSGLETVLVLHKLMLILPDDPTPQYGRESNVRLGAIHIRLLDALAEIVPGLTEMPTPAAMLPEEEPPLEMPVRRGDCTSMAIAMLELQRLAAIKPMKVTRQGWMVRTYANTLLKTLSAPPIGALGLVELAVRTELLTPQLRPGARQLRFDEPMYPLAEELLWSVVLHTRGDGEALGGFEQEQVIGWHTLAARRVLMGLLKRLPTDCWMRVSDLLDKVYALLSHPEDLKEASQRYRQIAQDTKNILLPMIVALLPSLGVLDIAGLNLQRPLSEWQAPPYQPTRDTGIYFRITGFGNDLLSRAPATDPVATPALQLNGLELIAPTRPNSDLLYRLAWIADPKPRKPQDSVQRLTLSRVRWTATNHAGADMEDVLTWLAKCTGRPLPAPILQQLKGWSSLSGQLRVFLGYALLRSDSPGARDLVAANFRGGIRVGSGDLLISQSIQLQGNILRIDYTGDPPLLQPAERQPWQFPRSLTITEDLTLLVDPDRADLQLTHLLDRITATGPAGRRLDPAAIRRSGLPTEEIHHQITSRFSQPPPPAAQLWLQSNLIDPEAVHLHTPELLLATDLIVSLLLQIPAAREMFIGTLAPDVLVLRPGARAELNRLLASLAVPTGTGLPILPLDAFAQAKEI